MVKLPMHIWLTRPQWVNQMRSWSYLLQPKRLIYKDLFEHVLNMISRWSLKCKLMIWIHLYISPLHWLNLLIAVNKASPNDKITFIWCPIISADLYNLMPYKFSKPVWVAVHRKVLDGTVACYLYGCDIIWETRHAYGKACLTHWPLGDLTTVSN